MTDWLYVKTSLLAGNYVTFISSEVTQILVQKWSMKYVKMTSHLWPQNVFLVISGIKQ